MNYERIYWMSCKKIIGQKLDGLVKLPTTVTPASAGVQNYSKKLDYGLRGNDGKRYFATFYGCIKTQK